MSKNWFGGMNIYKKVAGFMQLSRLRAASITAILPIYGALISSGSPTISQLFILLIIGILCHIWGFTLNAYMDIGVDKLSKIGYRNPLVLGIISRREALWICLISIFTAFTCTAFFFRAFLPLLFLGLSVILGCIYNVFSKKVAGMELFLSASFATFFLFGAVSVSASIPCVVAVFFLVIFIQRMFEDGLMGGLKDCGHDFLVGKTTVSRMGARLIDKTIKTTNKLKAYAYILRGFYTFLVIFWFMVLYSSYGYWNAYLVILVCILLALLVYSTKELVNNPDVWKFSRATLSHISLSYCCLIPAMLFPFVGVWVILLAIFPVAWFISFDRLSMLFMSTNGKKVGFLRGDRLRCLKCWNGC